MLHKERRKRKSRLSELSFICKTEGADFHWCGHNEGSLWRVTGCKVVMHEPTVDDRFILEDNLVAVAALETLLITVALVVAILDLLEVPYDTELAYRRNKMPFLLSILCHLKRQNPYRGTYVRTNADQYKELRNLYFVPMHLASNKTLSMKQIRNRIFWGI
jgi:hypothetical protein